MLVFRTPGGIFTLPMPSSSDKNDGNMLPMRASIQNPYNKPFPGSMACDARRNELFWMGDRFGYPMPYKTPLDGYGNGKDEEIVETGLVNARGVAYDWITGNVYFTELGDAEQNHKARIVVCGRGSTLCSVLLKEGIHQPIHIVVEPNERVMFWTDWGPTPKIMRAGMDGHFAQSIVSTELQRPQGISVDIQQDDGKRRIFWADSDKHTIESASLYGGDRRVIVAGLEAPFGIGIFAVRVFWSDQLKSTLASADKETGLDKKILYDLRNETRNLGEMVICHVDNQPNNVNPCTNSGCSHICTLSYEHASGCRCLCPVGMVLDGDRSENGKNCIDSPRTSPFQYVTDNNTIRFIRLHSIAKEWKDAFESVTISELSSISSLTHNPTKNNSLILSDSDEKKIYEYDMSTKKLEVLVDGDIDTVLDMDVDPIGENLYWADAGKQTVEVMSFHTKARAVLMTGVENIIDIAVVPELGSIFISRVRTGLGTIHQCQLDGGSSSIFLRVGDKRPIALAYENGKIYWIDKMGSTVHFTSLSNGTTFDIETFFYGGRILDGVIFNRETYWLDSSSRELRLSTNNMSELLADSFGKNSRMALSKNMAVQELLSSHECSWENLLRKKCSHICLLKGDGLRGECGCPEGSQLGEDGLTCIWSKSKSKPEGMSHNSPMISNVVKSLPLFALTAILLVGCWLHRKKAIKNVHQQSNNKPVACEGTRNDLFHVEVEEHSL